MKYSAILSSPLGNIGIITHQEKLVSLDILSISEKLIPPHDSYSKEVVSQINHYFADPTHVFKLEYDLRGTEFQKKVWRALLNIPSGKTLTYGMLAKLLDSGPRAIGQACRTNHIPVIIPCHRVVAAHHLGGYAGATEGRLIDIKSWLLQHEVSGSR